MLDGKFGDYEIFFDASGTLQRAGFVEMAVAAGKAIYCEKPTATNTAEALRLAQLAEDAGVKNGVVQDKLWLPGLRKLRMLRGDRILRRDPLGARRVRLLGLHRTRLRPAGSQRPSWNYRAEDGGSIMIDMFCHWRYVIDNLFGPIRRLVAYGQHRHPAARRGGGQRLRLHGRRLGLRHLRAGGRQRRCQFNSSSWCARVRRDDLLTIQVDGTKGSAVAGLREVDPPGAAATAQAGLEPRHPPADRLLRRLGAECPTTIDYDNAFKIQWEEFIRHVALDHHGATRSAKAPKASSSPSSG